MVERRTSTGLETANRAPHVLVIAGDAPLGARLSEVLGKRGFELTVVAESEQAVRCHRQDGADLVIAALPLAGTDARKLISALRAHDPRLPFILAGHDAEVAGAVEAFELGALDYVRDPQSDMQALLGAIGIALGMRRGDVHLRYLREKDAAGVTWEALGQCEAMQRVFAVVEQLCRRTQAGSTPTILITGETGTGKGLLAKCIHYQSVRRTQPFVGVNCAALPPSLIEAELFGYERGAFTGAHAAHPGLFETAHAGTLFLDEIGALPIELQAKLLTALEEKQVRRIGGRSSLAVDVQVVAATHRDLREAVANREFREDLLHRLDVVTVELPPLRARGGDAVLLAEEFIRAMCREYGMAPRRLADDARALVSRYRWPGNVRELRNQIERIVLLENDPVIRAEHFQLRDASLAVTLESRNGALRVELPPEGISLEAVEREILREAMRLSEGNVSRAARFLSISRQTLIYRLKKHGIDSSAAVTPAQA
ncbi:MAG TPA: sigma-54 dependent transcriptional regulator [Polyangia bacterium]|jgi:DNA-binding NtrC family response regulator